MLRPVVHGIVLIGLAATAVAQSAAAPGAMSVQQALALAQKGRCQEALPALRAGIPRIADKKARIAAAMALAKCGMGVGDYDTAVVALAQMRRDAPRDPEVLYIWARYFSQIANSAARELVESAPASVQVQRLNAEALESQGKSDEAIAAYRRILEVDPQARDVHFRLAQIILNQPATATTGEDARQELEAELKVNPGHAAAEFMLGELARRNGDWDVAIGHFGKASKLDAGFLEAYLALGMSFNAAGRFAEAIPPLERYVKLAAEDPAGHYQLAMAYARTGNKAGAARESELQRKAAEKTPVSPH